ncbi:hypothetical protein COBT_001565 [Conglomerata obtusa]
MASAMEAIQTFSGGEWEDITTWIKEILLVRVYFTTGRRNCVTHCSFATKIYYTKVVL